MSDPEDLESEVNKFFFELSTRMRPVLDDSLPVNSTAFTSKFMLLHYTVKNV